MNQDPRVSGDEHAEVYLHALEALEAQVRDVGRNEIRAQAVAHQNGSG
jgi:type II secretory pathway component PulM